MKHGLKGMRRRTLAMAGAGAFLTALMPCAAFASDFPSKPITLIAPTAPGGAMDGVARVLAERLKQRLGQPVVLDYKPGVGGTLGSGLAARATPDGHTLVIVADSYLTVSPRVLRGVSLQPFKDLAPVIEIGASPMVLVAHPSLGVRTLPEFLAKARADAGAIRYASAGMGSPHHLFMAQLEQQLGLRMNHVPYKGGPQAFSDLLGGHVDLMFIVDSTASAQIASGRLVPLGVSSAKRLAAYPGVPAIAESLPGYQREFWFAIFAPAGTPQPVIERLNREMSASLDEPEVQKAMVALGIAPATQRSPSALAQKLKAEDERMRVLIQSLGIKPE